MEHLPLRERPPATYFITTPTWRNRRIFERAAQARLLLNTLDHQRQEPFCHIHAFALLPDHMLLLLTPIDVTLERAITLIKGGVAFRLASRLPVWGRSFAQPLDDQNHIEYFRDFIHLRPCTARLATSPELYPYSSAYQAPAPQEPPFPVGLLDLGSPTHDTAATL